MLKSVLHSCPTRLSRIVLRKDQSEFSIERVEIMSLRN